MSHGAEKGWSAKVSAWILFAVVAAAPLPFGSANPIAMSFWCIILGICLITAAPRGLDRRHYALLALMAVVIAGYGFVLHEQLSSQPLVAQMHPLWREASEALGVTLLPSVSIASNEPYFALGSPLCCVLALMCGFLVCSDRDRAKQLLQVIAWSGVAYALYGIAAHLIDPTKLLWRDKLAYLSSVTSTFVNRNTAAVYFGSCAVVCLVLLCRRIRQTLPRGLVDWRAVPNRIVESTSREVLILSAMLFVCLVATFMTGSRAGAILSLAVMIVAFIGYFHRDLPRRSGVIGASLGGIAVALVLLQFMGGGVNARFDAEGGVDQGRLATYRATLRMIADYPWFGTGQGTFEWGYPAYRSSAVSMAGVWDRAHNTLLELAADMGVPLAALVAVGWVVIFAVLVHGVRTRRRDLQVPVAALSVAILAVLHSLVDFSLQIPGYSIVALALIGAGLAQSFASRRRQPSPESLKSQLNPEVAKHALGADAGL